MKIKEFRELKKHLDILLKKLEEQAISEGLDVSSVEYKKNIEKLTKQFFSQKGISEEDYKEINDNIKEGEDLAENEVLYFPSLVKKMKEKSKKKDTETQNNIIKVQNEFQVSLSDIQQEAKQETKNLEKQFIGELQKIRKQIPEIPKQLTKKDVEKIVSPLIPEIPEIPEPKEFNQDDIKGLKAEQVDIDLGAFDKKLEAAKQEMKEYTNQMSATRSGGGGGNTGKGSRFANKGAPDRHGYSDAGSFGTAIPDDRYALKGTTGATFVDDETPGGTKDGSNLTFTLAYTPISGSVKLFLGGTRLEVTNDFSISGTTITMIFAPESGETFLADYRR